MIDTDIVHFYKSEDVFDRAAAIFEDERKMLVGLFPNAEVRHVGSCAVPGAVSKFDVDIQVRVSQSDFLPVLAVMKSNYTSKHPHLWDDVSAIFHKDVPADIDYVLTVIDSPKDDYWRWRDFLIANSDVLNAYNEMKLRCEGMAYADYRKAKREFMGPAPGSNKYLKYDWVK